MARRRFLAGLRRSETKVVSPVAFAQYYASLAGYSHMTTREWPIERAVAEGFDRVMWVFKSVNTIAADSAGLPFRLRQGENEDDPVLTDHPLYRVLNKKANPLETGQIFRKRLSAQILLSKRGAFVEVTKSNAGSVIRLDLLPPDRVEIIPDTGGGVDHFRFNKRNGDVKNLRPDQVRWFRDPHPIDPYSGVTPLESMGMSVELDHFARLYNVSFMQNDGRPGGVIGVKGLNATGPAADMSERHMNRIEERFGKGPVEAGKLSVVAGELSYVDLAARPRDMQYGATSRNAKIEILSGFGIGESVFGYAAERTFDNADNELYVYWSRTMPAHNKIILTGFDEDSDDDLNGFLDTASVEILERTAKAKRVEWREEVAAGLRSIKSYADAAGHGDEIESTPHTRALYIATGKTPLPSTAADAEALGLGTPTDDASGGGAPEGEGEGEPPAPEAPEPGGPPTPTGGDDAGTPPPPPGEAPSGEGAARAALRAVAGKDVALRVVDGPKVHAAYRLSRKAAPERDEAVTDSSVNERAARDLEDEIATMLAELSERWVERAVARLQSPKQRKHTRHFAPEYEHDTRVGTKALDAARAVDEGTWQAEAEREAHPIVLAAAIAAGTALLADMGITPPPGYTLARMAADAVAQNVAHVVGFIGRSAARQAGRLVADLNRADQEDEDLDGIIALARSHVGRLAGWATGLATQAAGATVNGSRDDAAREANRDEALTIERYWISRRDEKVRPTHKLADGQVRGLDEPFIVGDSLLRFPQDPLAPPGETANCRCRLLHRSKRTGRWVAQGKAVLPRDGDGDGFVYDSTPRQRPASPRPPLREARGNETAIARGAKRIAAYREEARAYDGPSLRHRSWEDVSSALLHMFVGTVKTSSGRTVHAEVHAPGYDGLTESDDGHRYRMYSANGGLYDAESGLMVGHFQRSVLVSLDDDSIEVNHDGFSVDPEAQGEGIGSEFLARSLAWYRQMGVSRVTLNASGSLKQTPKPRRESSEPVPLLEALQAAPPASNGGYTWGEVGFDFTGNAFGNTLPGRLLGSVDAQRSLGADGVNIPAVLRAWDDVDPAQRMAAMILLGRLAEVVPDSWWDSEKQRAVLADFLDTTSLDKPPTPWEVNRLGQEAKFTDRETGEQTWLGKALMSRSAWAGHFDMDWLNAYPETKALSKRGRTLGGLLLAALGSNEPLLETKGAGGETLDLIGRILANAEARLERWPRPGDHDEPRDGDGDGFVYDSTPRQRLARPKPRVAGVGRPWSEVEDRRRARLAAEAAAREAAKKPPDPELDSLDLIRPGDPLPDEVLHGQATSSARTLNRNLSDLLTERGADPGRLDFISLHAMSYDDAVRRGDDLAALEALARLHDALQRLKDLRNPDGTLMFDDEELGDAFEHLSSLHRLAPALAKALYTRGVEAKTIHRGAQARDGDGDGFVDDGKPTMRPAPPKRVERWRRHPTGYMSPDGEWFLERGAPMSSGGTDAWLIHRRVPEDQVGRDGGSAYQVGGRGGVLFAFPEGTSVSSDYTGDLYSHEADAGSLAEAKYTVEYLKQREAGVTDDDVAYHQGRDLAEQRFSGMSTEQMRIGLERVRAAREDMEGHEHATFSGVVDWLAEALAPHDGGEPTPDQDPDREAVYEAERTLLAPMDRMRAISDADAAAIASKHVGEDVTILRTDETLGDLEPGRHLFGVWLKDGPVIVAPPGYALSPFEVYHETAHLLTSHGHDVRGHGKEFQEAYLRILPEALANRLRPGFPAVESPADASNATYGVTYRGLDDGEGMVTATVGDEVIGALRWNFYEDPPVVVDMSVDEKYRRQGVGTRLFEEARKHESRLQHSDSLTDDGAAFVEASTAEPDPDPEPEPPREGGVRIEGLSKISGYDAYEGTIAEGTPPLWRHIGDRWELQSVVESRGDTWDASEGGFTARKLEGDTQFAATREQALAWEHSQRRTQNGYHLLVSADVSGLPARFIGRTEQWEHRPPNLEIDGDNATMYPDTGLGIGVLGGIPVDRIRSIETFHPADGKVTKRFESFAEYALWQDRLNGRAERNPEFGQRIGDLMEVPQPGGGVHIMERVGGRWPDQTVDRVLWRVERRDGVWGVYPPTEQSPATFQTGSKAEARKWALARGSRIDPPRPVVESIVDSDLTRANLLRLVTKLHTDSPRLPAWMVAGFDSATDVREHTEDMTDTEARAALAEYLASAGFTLADLLDA